MKLPGILSALLCSVLSCPLLLSGQAHPTISRRQRRRKFIPTRAISRPPATPTGISDSPSIFPPDVQLGASSAAGRARRPDSDAATGRPSAGVCGGVDRRFSAAREDHAVDAKAILRKALDQELLYGVEELHGLSKTTLAGHLFYFYETRRGADQHMALASNLEGYAVVVVLAANNEKTVKELESSFQHVTFIAPAKVREYAGADAEEYEGPAISSHRLAQLQADPPANHIDAGKFSGNVYENQGLGFSYRIPAGLDAGSRRGGAACHRALTQEEFRRPLDGRG